MGSNKSDIGIIGLGKMGQNLARNFADNDFSVSVFNMELQVEGQTTSDFTEMLSDQDFYKAADLADFVDSLCKERVIFLLVQSEESTDHVIESLIPLVDSCDIIVDAGDSFYKDTVRRQNRLVENGIEFVGMGMSGIVEGSLMEPSLMPGGSNKAKMKLMPILEKISAKVNGEACVSWIGEKGSGHFVKMVQDGIANAEMQLIAELYEVCRLGMKMNNEEITKFIEEKLIDIHEGYLLEITKDILRKKEGEEYVLDTILDVAGIEKISKWVCLEAIELGVPIPTIAAATNQRFLSSLIDLRRDFSTTAHRPQNVLVKDSMMQILPQAFLCARMIAYAEGFHLMSIASKTYNWNLDFSEIARIWRGGCMISSNMLYLFKQAFDEAKEEGKEILHLFESPMIGAMMNNTNILLASVITSTSVASSIALPSFSAASNYLRSFSSVTLPSNMIQAQLDYYGAESYRTI